MPTANMSQYMPTRAPAIPASWAAKDAATRAALGPQAAVGGPPAAGPPTVGPITLDSPYTAPPPTAMGAAAGAGDLPNSSAALAQMRDLQTRSLSGLQGLMARDTTAKRKAAEDAMFASSSEAIDRAADMERRKMLEGTFGRGVGNSTIVENLAQTLGQTHRDALSRASREAFLAAGAEDRADLASELGVANAGFGAATTGMQAEHNVLQKIADRLQQESQFGRDLAFRGSEGAANRGLTSSLAAQDLGFRNRQLEQQNSQFGQNLSFLGSENAANRAHQTGMLGQQQSFMGSENAASRDLQRFLAEMGIEFQGNQAQLNRDFTGGQNQASRDLSRQLAEMGYDFTGSQNALNRDFTASQSQLGRDFSGNQAQLSRDQQMEMLLLQLANSQDLAGQQMLGGGLAGAGDLLGRILAGLGS